MADFTPNIPRSLFAHLSTEIEEFDLGRRFAVYLVLKNLLTSVITISNRPLIYASVFDSSGDELKQLDYSSSGPEPLVQWAKIPRDAYLGLRVDDQGAGIPPKCKGTTLLAMGGKSWALASGSYTLQAACEFKHGISGPNNQWLGKIDLTLADLVVSNTDGECDNA